MPIVSHTFDGPLIALEGVARDHTAKYITQVWGTTRVTVVFKVPADIRVGRLPTSEKYAAMVALLAKKRKIRRYVGK
jgi:hypothetical protein